MPVQLDPLIRKPRIREPRIGIDTFAPLRPPVPTPRVPEVPEPAFPEPIPMPESSQELPQPVSPVKPMNLATPVPTFNEIPSVHEGPPPPEFVAPPIGQLSVNAQAIIDKLAQDVDESRSQVEYFDELVAGAQQAIETATTPAEKAKGRVALARAQRQQGIAEAKNKALTTRAEAQRKVLETRTAAEQKLLEAQEKAKAKARADFQVQQRLTRLRPILANLKDAEKNAIDEFDEQGVAAAKQAQTKIQRLIDAVQASRGRTVLPVDPDPDARRFMEQELVWIDTLSGSVYTKSEDISEGSWAIERDPRIVFDGATGQWLVEIDGTWVYAKEINGAPFSLGGQRRF